MAFTGNQIFPGFQAVGHIPEPLRAGLVVYSAGALNSLQGMPEDIVRWADIAGVTPGDFTAKIPIDITALDGFKEDDGTELDYKQADLIAVDVASVPFYRAVEWPSLLAKAGPLTNVQNLGASVIMQARRHKARLAATVLMQGRPGGKAFTYEQIGAPNGLTLFNTAHYVNPKIAAFGTFSNYMTAAGKFDSALLKRIRTALRMVPSPTGSAETLGLKLTRLIAPSHMAEPIRDVAIATLNIQTAVVNGNGVAAAVTNTATAAGEDPWTWEIAPQLDNDPYLAAYKLANPSWTPETLPHLLFAVSESIPGANLIEMIAPSQAFVPTLSVLGIGSEHEIKRQKVAIIARMQAGAAAGLPHVGMRIEET